MGDTKRKNAAKAAELGSVANITVLDVEITSNESVTNAIKSIIEKEGRIDVVVNNAGYFGGGLAERYTVERIYKKCLMCT